MAQNIRNNIQNSPSLVHILSAAPLLSLCKLWPQQRWSYPLFFIWEQVGITDRTICSTRSITLGPPFYDNFLLARPSTIALVASYKSIFNPITWHITICTIVFLWSFHLQMLFLFSCKPAFQLFLLWLSIYMHLLGFYFS